MSAQADVLTELAYFLPFRSEVDRDAYIVRVNDAFPDAPEPVDEPVKDEPVTDDEPKQDPRSVTFSGDVISGPSKHTAN